MKKYIVIPMVCIVISSCSLLPTSEEEIIEYCENSEYSVKKQAALTLLEIIGKFFSIPMELDRGLCEKYYLKRDNKITCLTKEIINVSN